MFKTFTGTAIMFELKPGTLCGLSEPDKRKWLKLITSEGARFHGSTFSGIQQVCDFSKT